MLVCFVDGLNAWALFLDTLFEFKVVVEPDLPEGWLETFRVADVSEKVGNAGA